MERARVNALIVDDSQMERHHVSILLRHLGVNSDHAKDSMKANLLTELHEYDIVLVNSHMMRDDPAELVRSLLALPSINDRGVPIIEMGNSLLGSEKIEGCRGYLDTPVLAYELRRILIESLPAEKADRIECITSKDGGAPACQLLMMIDEGEKFDTKAGMRNCGTMENYLSALKIFYDTLGAKADEIEDLYNKSDIPGYTIKVHALKSSARLIGALKLSAQAALLEDAGNAKDIETVERDTEALLKAYRQLGEKFSELFEEEDDEEKPLADAAVLEDAYASLREFADDMDFDLAKMVLDSLSEYSFEKEDEIKIKKINDCLLQLDWDGIMAQL